MTVISGETGCGKTTQVPQFILDDAIASGNGLSCNLICTQVCVCLRKTSLSLSISLTHTLSISLNLSLRPTHVHTYTHTHTHCAGVDLSSYAHTLYVPHISCFSNPTTPLALQPRRISAISVAQRVASERGEVCGGSGKSSTGYSIRLESCLPRKQASIVFCTTGVLLRRLADDPMLAAVRCVNVCESCVCVCVCVRYALSGSVLCIWFLTLWFHVFNNINSKRSHVVVDEIHERDILSDFLLILLRDLIKIRPDLKLVLMSATLNAQTFADYFGHCEILQIPGERNI